MNVLLIGSGAREHALAWKLAQSPRLDRMYAAPGNPGIFAHATAAAIDPNDHEAVIAFCRDHDVDLVVVGPEAPLVAGLGDRLREAGIATFGPDAAAAQVEGSKGFTKDLCAASAIPTANYVRVSDRAAAEAALARFGAPVVIKADGLAAGKGVTVAMTEAEAKAALDNVFAGDAAGELVIEEYMEGEEVSLFALVDRETVLPFGSAQDHKRVGDGDTGPNTGGMGAYSPAPILTRDLERRAMEEILIPTARALARGGTPYSGILYAGLMLTADGPKLVEYNARFGDPECQVLMMRLESDLLEIMAAVAQGRPVPEPAFADRTALTVVMAASGYPGTPQTGGSIEGIEEAEARGVQVFQAGTAIQDGRLVAAGGRVLSVTADGADIAEARERVYRAVGAIDFPSGFFRSDIGWREIARRGGTKVGDGAGS